MLLEPLMLAKLSTTNASRQDWVCLFSVGDIIFLCKQVHPLKIIALIDIVIFY